MAVELATLVVGDEPEAWAAAGFAVEGRSCRVGDVRLILVGADGSRGVVGWSFRGLAESVGQVDGLPVGPEEPAPDGEGAPHPNGVTALDHVVLMTPDRERTTSALAAVGLDARRVREIPGAYEEAGPATQTFFRMGRPILELVAPAAATDGPCRFFGLAFDVADLDVLPAFYGERLGPLKDAVQPGRRIATLRHKDLGLSVATALMTAEGPRPSRR